MDSVGLFQAKTHLSALLDRVESGETITITRRGRVAALLTPPPANRAADVRQAVDAIKQLRKGRRLGPGVTLRQLIDEGRRF